jgi:hypothetical protein
MDALYITLSKNQAQCPNREALLREISATLFDEKETAKFYTQQTKIPSILPLPNLQVA